MLCETGCKSCVLFSYCRQENATFTPHSHTTWEVPFSAALWDGRKHHRLECPGGPNLRLSIDCSFTMESRRWFTASACARFIIRESKVTWEVANLQASVWIWNILRNRAYAFTSAVLDTMKVTGLLSSKQICRSGLIWNYGRGEDKSVNTLPLFCPNMSSPLNHCTFIRPFL